MRAALSSTARLLLALIAIAGAGGCDAVSPTPVAGPLALQVSDPVQARFVASTGVFVAEFPLTIVDARGPGGSLAAVEAVVTSRASGSVLARNQRPNGTVGLPETVVPQRGALTVEMGIGFALADDEGALLTVRARLTDGRDVARTVGVDGARSPRGQAPFTPSCFSSSRVTRR